MTKIINEIKNTINVLQEQCDNLENKVSDKIKEVKINIAKKLSKLNSEASEIYNDYAKELENKG